MLFRIRVAVLGVCVLGFMAGGALAGPQEAAGKVAEGDALLAKADFDGALAAYVAATKADPENADYRAKAIILRRVINLRGSLDEQPQRENWSELAAAVHSYYMENKVYGEALNLALKMHAKGSSAETAARLARVRLALGQNADAAEGLRNLIEAQVNAEVRVLLAVALGRAGQVEDAQGVLKEVETPADADGLYMFDLARAQALAGDRSAAAAALTASFERTPPSRLDSLKAEARASTDLAGLRGTPEFVEALETVSKVAESKCSSGASCGKCPSKASCAGAAKEPAKDGAAQDPHAGCAHGEKKEGDKNP